MPAFFLLQNPFGRRHLVNSGLQLAGMLHGAGPALKNGLDDMVAIVSVGHIDVHSDTTMYRECPEKLMNELSLELPYPLT
jgi:hypothetical protein